MDRLQRPPDRLDVVWIERLVRVLGVDPKTDPVGQPDPVLDVAQHQLAAAGVEAIDPVVLDVGLLFHPELGLDGELDRQPVAIPAALALDLVPAHRLVAGEDVLEHTREHVVGSGGAVGRRWPLEEPPARAAVAALDRLREDVPLAPAHEHLLLEFGERRSRIDGAVGGHWGVWGRHWRERRFYERGGSSAVTVLLV